MSSPPHTSAPRINWSGYYYDGQTSRRHDVTITLVPGGLHITKPDGSTLWWLHSQLQATGSEQTGEPVRLEKLDTLGEAVVVSEEGFRETLRQFGAGTSLVTSFQQAARPSYRRALLLASLAAIIFVGAALYLWGIPALTRRAAERVPLAWEERLGDAVVSQLAPAELRCSRPEQQAILDQITAQLLAAATPSPYHVRVWVVDTPVANAFAAPGGRIAIFRGLLEKTERAEDLAGVLAHEIQHVLQHHPVQAVLRQLSLQALAGVLAGDSAGLSSALSAAGTLGSLSYHRDDEASADREGVRMLQLARIDPSGLALVLQKLQEDEGDAPENLRYLSTHPLPAARLQQLRQLAARPAEPPLPLTPEFPWARMLEICEPP